MVIVSNARERGRFMRFAMVGVVGAIVDFGVMNLLTRAFGVRLFWAGAVSFICAILSNFTWNRYFTYPDSRSKKITSQLLQFSLISIMGLAIREPILLLLEHPMEDLLALYQIAWPPYLSSKAIADNLTLALAVIVVMFWNFFANRYWTYSDVE